MSSLAELPASHPVKNFCARVLGRTLHVVAGNWFSIHKRRRVIRDQLQQQYLITCSGYRMTPIAVQALRRINFSASQDTLSLSRQGLTKLALKAFLEAVTGRCWLSSVYLLFACLLGWYLCEVLGWPSRLLFYLLRLLSVEIKEKTGGLSCCLLRCVC